MHFFRATVFATVLLAAISIAPAHTILIEAESFENLGGWVVDQQFMDQMGSPYLLAHGLGQAIEDAATTVTFPAGGKYRIWVRTRDWAATWNNPEPAKKSRITEPRCMTCHRVDTADPPGKFQVLIDGKALPTVFGTEGTDWHWQDGGTVENAKEKVTLALRDLTGFEGRCDAIVFTTDTDFRPPDTGEDLAAFRRKMLGLAEEPQDAGQFDLVVLGGGMAGTCAAVSAARLGLQVALVQDRPVLGGNNSSEVRVHLNGQINLPPYPALGDVVKELDSGKRGNAQPAENYDDQKKLAVIQAEKNIHLFLNTHVYRVEKDGSRIVAVVGKDIRTGKELRFSGWLFADCTGDGTVGFLAGADSRIGREPQSETGETLAPEKPDNLTLGTSVQWYCAKTEQPVSFPECPWSLKFTEESCQHATRGDWNWETGFGRDQIAKAEHIRDYALRAIYGNWAFLKNSSQRKAEYADQKLAWAAYIVGKRESRRLLGDVILQQQDIQDRREFPDAFVTTTWTIDLHYPDPKNTEHFRNGEFRSIAKFTPIEPYAIPYRCLYSRNIENLFMAGRDISVTHVALGTTRVMRTCGMMGELVGMAASVGRKHSTTPRGVYQNHLDELKALAQCGVGKTASQQTSGLPRLKVSDNGRFLVTDKGEPFFWLGDTAWMLRTIPSAEVDYYMSNRVQHHFNVIQVHCGFNVTDYAGNQPFSEDNTDAPNEVFWRNIDTIVKKAHDSRLYIALVPMWGDEYRKAFGNDSQKAYRFGQWIGKRYASHRHVFWIVSGEYDAINGYRLPISAAQKSIFISMARGLREAHNGAQLMTMHPGAARTSSKDFHEEPWLDFNMLQSGHLIDSAVYKMPDTYELIARDYALALTKPVLDGEPIYEDTPDGIWVHRDMNRPRAGALAVRRKAYWAVFAGAFGHTYGHNDVYSFFEPAYPGQIQTLPKGPGQRSSWKTALDAPGAAQMKHLRLLMESRSHLDRIPDQSLIAGGQGTGLKHVQATRAIDGRWAMVYLPAETPVTIAMDKLAGPKVNASWFDPGTAKTEPTGVFANIGTREFTPPSSGEASDWVLVLDGKTDSDKDFMQALENGRLANEGFVRCQRFVQGWLKYADPKTGLIPRNLTKDKDIWNAQDAAADNYPFMVLTAAITDRQLFNGRMLDMLRAETKLTSRIGNLPDTYSFSQQGFAQAEPDITRIIFGSAEYVKDGLLPLTEWLGKSPWCDRMLAILDDIWKHAPIETKYGRIISTNVEVNGEMLQTLSRIYWMTGEKKYLDWAIRLGDYYLLDGHHPTRDEKMLRLRDHGCEIISGLCELYATVHSALPEKKQAYEKPMHQMLDRILEVARNEYGLFYNWVDPQTGQHDKNLADTWGYDFNGYYTVYLIDKTPAYRDAAIKALSNLNEHYRNYPWEGSGADGYADSIESALNLYNREPVPSVADWLDSEIKRMWNIQKQDGVIEGWHGDGNFARTTIMYCLWKTAGLTIAPWRQDVIFGAVQDGDSLKIALRAENAWQGKLIFDVPRHKVNMRLPLDWPRINQFPQWFTVEADKTYTIYDLTGNSKARHKGRQLSEGVGVKLQPGAERLLAAQ
jgi:hypothetical protein